MKQPDDKKLRSIDESLRFIECNPDFHTPRILALRDDLAAAGEEAHKFVNQQGIEQLHLGSDGEILAQLKENLRVKHMLPISRAAAVLLRGLPGAKDSFRVPPKWASVEDLAEAARRIATEAKMHKPTFVRAKHPRDFITQLLRAAKAMEQKAANPDTVINRRSLATRGLKDPIRRGREIINAISAAVAAELGDKMEASKRWKHASRLPERIGRPRKPREKPPENPELGA